MSSVYQPKRKELAKVKVMSTQDYDKNRSKLKFVGRVKRGYTAFITTQTNKKTGKCSFIDDTSSLTKRTKSDIVRFFSDKANEKKQVAYLVVPKISGNAKPKSVKKTIFVDNKISSERKQTKNPYNDFVYTSTGRIKGSYNVDGFFEPD